MTKPHDICRLDAVTLAAQIRDKTLSPIEVVDAFLDQQDVLDRHVHAFCTPTRDAARAAARSIERDIMAGKRVGPLAGVPVGVKDLICTKGVRTTSGSKAYEHFIPEEDDIVVERLSAAGAVVVGKTNVSEFGYGGFGHNPLFETTRNPWNLNLTSGGSSAGSAAAVATGMVPFALGSDGGGSIRIPSSLCGLYGIKASMGRVPLYPGCRDERYPGVSSWESLECIGPLSRTVADSALMLSVISGPDDRDRHTLPAPGFDWMQALGGGVRGLRVAYSPDWGYAPVDPRVRDLVGKAVRVFERDLGCTVEEAHPGWQDPSEAFLGLVALETDLVGMRALADQYEREMSPHLIEFLRRPWTAEDLTNAVVIRKAVTNKMWRFMRTYDLLVTPTLAVPAFPVNVLGPERIDGRTVRPSDWHPFTFLANMTGQPAASVPAGWTDDGLPVGLQIIGRHLDDTTVLRASAAFEAAAPWKNRWPPVLDRLGR